MKDKAIFPCDTCEYVSNSKASMKKHSISHSKDLQTCDECDQQFATSKGLLLHKAKSHKAIDGAEALEKVLDENSTSDKLSVVKKGLLEKNDSFEDDAKVKNVKVKKEKKKSSNENKKSSKENKKISKENKNSSKENKKSSKDKTKKVKKQKLEDISTSSEALSVFDQCEPVHQVANVSPFDFWSDGEDDFKLMWLEEMASTSCSPGCHCRVCQPCTKPCCENSAVRTGKCCDPSTLGSCLQPFQAQCFAPCCHHSVQLRDNFRWVGGRLVEDVGRVNLVNPLEKESGMTDNVLVDEMFLKEDLGECLVDNLVEEEMGEVACNKSSDYVPQAFINDSISKYLDLKLGKAIPKSNFKKEYFKFYKDSSLPGGCRIVHKKSGESTRVEVFFRSKCGRFFKSRSELMSYVETREQAMKKENEKVVFKKTSVVKTLEESTQEFVESLYKIKDDSDASLTRSETIPAVPIRMVEDKMKLKVEDFETNCDEVFDKSDDSLIKSININEEIDSKPTIAKNGTLPLFQFNKKPASDKSDSTVLKSKYQKQEVKNSRPQDQSISSRLPIKPGVKTCRCEECGVTLSLNEITKHLVTIHPGVKMNRCMICKSGFMNIHSFKAHKERFHAADQEQGSSTEKISGRPHTNMNIPSMPKTTAMKEESRPRGREASVQHPVKDQSLHCIDGIQQKYSSEKVEIENEIAQVNTSTSDLNDSVETLDKIELFLSNSATTIQKVKAKQSHSVGGKVPSKATVSQFKSTPPSSKVNTASPRFKKLGEVDTKKAKRSRSSTNYMPDIPSTRKRTRTSCTESYTEMPLRDTDPDHPTSSFNLRLKGRNHKGTKKLTPMGVLTMYNKFPLDPSTTINDYVDGELLVFTPIRPDYYYCISAEEEVTENDEDVDMVKNDDRRPTNSNVLRKKGRDHKGKQLLKAFPPLLDFTDDMVRESMVDKKDASVATTERFFRISS